MDPHSRFSHFDNKRSPKSGPQSVSQKPRFFESQLKPSLDNFASAKQQRKSSSSGPISIPRPFITNSRVKQDEKTRKDMYLAFVNNALQEKANGRTDSYEELVGQFNPKRSPTELPFPQPAQLRLWILALSHVVSRLERAHSSLVEAIINMPWVTMDNTTVRSYTVFVGMLLSARPEYLSLVLSKLSLGFTYQAAYQALSASPAETSSSPLTRRSIYDRLHNLLQHLLSLIPTLPSTLMPLLSRNFPHKRQSQTAQITYIRNLLRISEYCPELADQILGVIVDRAIQIDVEIQVEIDEIEDDEPAQEQDDIFELDPFDIVVGQEGDEDNESDLDSSADEFDDTFSDLSSEGGDFEEDGARKDDIPTNHQHLREMVKKLDSILSLVFDRFRATHSAVEARQRSGEDEDREPPSILPDLPPLPPISTAVNPFFDINYSSPIIDSLSFQSNQAQMAQLNQLASSSSYPSTPTSTPASSSWLLTNQLASSIPPPTKRTLRMQFHTLLSIFDRTILRTFKSRYTQFLLFWYSSLDPEFSDIFQGMLVDRALFHPSEPDLSSGGGNAGVPTPVVTRAAAASYIGSYVSRAKFIDRGGARRVVGILCEFMKAHLDGVEGILKSAVALSAKRSSSYRATNEVLDALNVIGDQNTIFYAVAQAVFLIFCFRWRDLLEDGSEEEQEDGMKTVDLSTRNRGRGGAGGKKWMKQLDVMHRVVNSVLNPLKACSPNVASQFARVAHATDFIYCYTILESNRRSGPEAASSTSEGQPSSTALASASSTFANPHAHGINVDLASELNTFFPFDPYKLPKSGLYIQKVYREWGEVAIDEESDEESDDGEDDIDNDEVEANVDNFGRARSISMSVPGAAQGKDSPEAEQGLGASFDAMIISPVKGGIDAAGAGDVVVLSA
ncbi:hypothetical protein D9757_001248 [Collybiopsis confluens]|uniref:RNA polymerase I-specific transcription initiation factor RRN3 n=1 Tax=Collybiopsis confluens TaxID=2823264 RepID=A0A8H5MGQ0_9AGAR|nr:hypothetical protein D9757_001248 [Collybiopsis confluens]